MNYEISNFPLDLVLNLLSIVILFVIIRIFAYKPAKKFLDARREKLAKEKTDAANEKSDAEKLKAEYEAKLAEADADAAREAERIISEAREKADKIVAEANERAEKVLSLAEAKIKADREASKKAMEKESVTMALEIAEKILERRVSDSDTINMAHKLFGEADK